jgi:hypothetical protein
MVKVKIRLRFSGLIVPLMFILLPSCGGEQTGNNKMTLLEKLESVIEGESPDDYNPVNAMLVLPENPAPGESFRILATGGRNIRKAKIIVSSPSGNLESLKHKTGDELPCWRTDDFAGVAEGNYRATLSVDEKEISNLEFVIAPRKVTSPKGVVWTTTCTWDSKMETIYSAWVNALFQDSNEQTSWPNLHEVTQNKDHNFLYNYLSLEEDDPESISKVIMEPDCADNPFFLRAYFAWKLRLPFGFHVCDRGYLGKNPNTGQWITNETSSPKTNRFWPSIPF